MDRKQVLAYRIAAHGLHRDTADAAKLAVFDLGMQDITKRDSATVALLARLPAGTAEGLAKESFVDDPRFVLAWSHRGAPHFHRAGDLPDVRAALVPLNDADALARMGWQRREVAGSGLGAREVLFTAARAMQAVVDRPMTKGAASTAVSLRIPESLCRWCRSCQATHIHEQLMRVASLHGGVRLEKGVSPATLAPVDGRGEVNETPAVAAATGVVRAYLRLHGPATGTEAAAFVGTTREVLQEMWPEDLVEVAANGRKTYLPAQDLAALENPPEPDVVRLLPPWDPFLQARDRRLLVPDPALNKEVWKILGNPGVVLAHGDIAGTWRTKSSGSRVEFTMSPFWTLPAAARAAAEAEAERIARARGFADLRVRW